MWANRPCHGGPGGIIGCRGDGWQPRACKPYVVGGRYMGEGVKRGLSDDGGDFRVFFNDLLPKVMRVAQQVSGDRADAEDIAAEAFARAFARWGRLRNLPYRDAWVVRVAANLGVDLIRRRSRPPIAVTSKSSDWTDLVELRMTFRLCLDRLSRAQREVVILRYLADMSEAEVAAVMKIRPGTVKSHLRRALQTLRGELGEDLEAIG